MKKRNLTQAKSHFNLNKAELYFKKDKEIDEEIEKCYSTTDDSYSFIEDIIERDINEDILIEIAKNQKMIKNYSPGGIGFSSRGIIFNWVENVINCLNLHSYNRTSIYFRFTSIYGIVMSQMFIENKVINNDEELKKIITTIFLIAYKFEGHTIVPISIPSIITAFLNNLNQSPNDLIDEIRKIEVNILELLDYDFNSFNTNVHTLTNIIFALFKKHFGLSEEITQLIEDTLPKINKHIILSETVIFNNLPIDIAALSISATFNYINKALSNEMNTRLMNFNEPFDPFWIQLLIKDISNLSNELYSYLKNELKVIRVTINCINAFPLLF